MFITLCYIYLWLRYTRCYSAVLRDTLRRSSTSRCGFTFCTLYPERCPPAAARGHPQPGSVLITVGDKAVYITEPQACEDLSSWTVLSPSPSVAAGPRPENVCFIIEATAHHSDATRSNDKVVKWSECCVPLAREPGQTFRAVCQASLDDFSRLGVAFIEDRLALGNGLVPSKIVSVLLQESSLKELLEKPRTENTDNLSSLALDNTQTEIVLSVASPRDRRDEEPDLQHTQCRKGSLLLPPDTRKRLEERRGSEPLCSGSQEPAAGHMSAHSHTHLHLSNCHECLELENSTILSVKYASAENIPDLPDDADRTAPSGSEDEDEGLDDFQDDAMGSGRGRDGTGKPPNVLVYTGGSEERFQQIRGLLAECVDTERYVIYHLQPRHVLTQPWLHCTKLLVLAELETLTPQLQTRFLHYLGVAGGRVLGLSSTLCPSGLCLEARESRRQRIGRLSFTREDSTQLQLSVRASGQVFVRDPRGGGEVELWGEMTGGQEEDAPHRAHGQRDMVIVRLTHGEDGGEAVLCQVHLEMSAESQEVTSGGFDELKSSNARRYEVLTEILTSLGLSCELGQTPPATPVYLFSTCQENRARFLTWLRAHADPGGLIRSSKTPLRLVSASGCPQGGGDPRPGRGLGLGGGAGDPPGTLALVTEPPEARVRSEQFSVDAYREHLRTRTLGHTLLYTEVTPTTMDLLEGLVMHVPEDTGLIAIAGRQSRGRGRGGNCWLSPVGSVSFTLNVRVDLKSRLGQSIPFLQHLAALAVVEAVRTLPGYQDIDLRVKWPNDIYYSDLMKLGGVLVTSTVMGPTFHLLIGCGFNVSNSNPTICINDLVRQHNAQHGTQLQPLCSTQLIARAVTSLEGLVDAFQKKGPDAVLPLYYKRWLHSGTRVRLWSEDGPEAEVVGLDDSGFLQVYCKEQGVVSVEPDGNSFDMLMNLLVSKRSA